MMGYSMSFKEKLAAFFRGRYGNDKLNMALACVYCAVVVIGSLFDATQTMVAKINDDTYQVQVVSWYDNENSYTSQMVRTIKYFAEL